MPTLSAADTERLWTQFLRERDDPSRAALIEGHRYLVGRVVGRMFIADGILADAGDLESAGLLALIKAVDDYDPARGSRFALFAAFRIRHAILDLMRRDSFFPLHVGRLARHVRRVTGTAPAELSAPQMEVLAATLLMDIDQAYELRLLLLRGELLSLEEVEPPSDDAEPEEEARRRIIAGRVDAALHALPEPERGVVREYWWRGRTLAEIAREMGRSRQSVSLIHARGIEMVARWLAEDGEFIRAGGGE